MSDEKLVKGLIYRIYAELHKSLVIHGIYQIAILKLDGECKTIGENPKLTDVVDGGFRTRHDFECTTNSPIILN